MRVSWRPRPTLAANASDVAINDIYDPGVTRIPHGNGAGQTRMEDGILQGNPLGFRGNEHLGNGLSAFFNLLIRHREA